MAYNAKRIMFYATAGFLVATLIIVGVVISGGNIPSFTSNTGTLIVKLTDAPVELDHLNVTISNLSAQRVGQNEETWEELSFVDSIPDVYVDILALQNVTMDLAITELLPGNYTKLRMTVTTANATYVGGETRDLIVPSGHVDIIVHFEIKAGESTTVLVDMQADWIAISNSGRLRPVLKAIVI